jgi:hypothetical protein
VSYAAERRFDPKYMPMVCQAQGFWCQASIFPKCSGEFPISTNGPVSVGVEPAGRFFWSSALNDRAYFPLTGLTRLFSAHAPFRLRGIGSVLNFFRMDG